MWEFFFWRQLFCMEKGQKLNIFFETNHFLKNSPTICSCFYSASFQNKSDKKGHFVRKMKLFSEMAREGQNFLRFSPSFHFWRICFTIFMQFFVLCKLVFFVFLLGKFEQRKTPGTSGLQPKNGSLRRSVKGRFCA